MKSKKMPKVKNKMFQVSSISEIGRPESGKRGEVQDVFEKNDSDASNRDSVITHLQCSLCDISYVNHDASNDD